VSELVQFLVRHIVSKPDAVRVNEVVGESAILLELAVDAVDFEAVRGADGETLRAIRTVLSAASGKRKAVLELIEPGADGDEEE
jgi:predicted RNA-binding protein YlqC (UPF0109 family)